MVAKMCENIGGNICISNNQAGGSSLQNFFSNKCILVTGGTGFVGKCLVEKLLHSCPEIRVIYLLIRPKKGLDVATRFQELIKHPVFERLRAESPRALDKMAPVGGDVSLPGLGLSEADRLQLVTSVHVVFHSAATVRFDEKLRTAVSLNVAGTQRLVELGQDMNKLQAFVHVSTAYCNADKHEVKEAVYPPPASPEAVMHWCDTLPDDVLETVSERLRGKHPNTYTLTKAMAEWIVSEQTNNMPTAIVRPSIVTAAWREPLPGWIDNVCGITGIIVEIGRGTIRSIVCDQKLVMDVIPVDFVVNTLIAVAWRTATHRSNTVQVYNCTSGSLNPILWEEFGQLTQKETCEFPTRHVMWYPGFTFRTNHFIHKICDSLFHFFPAFLVDILLRLQGAKPIMLKISQRFRKAAKTGEFFALNEWKFQCDNIRSLQLDPEDKKLFEVDITQMNWEKYTQQYILGIRKFILKDSVDTLPFARQKLRRLYWLHRITQVLSALLFIKAIKHAT
ncbi:putative fatty acyl-CoA reductase CG5065 [Bacillus rossius redtenbacheri]|uniref:putative fatty acyl-CoA reductase CG5065 n=1 Tax=Bacillus rossius redtenbacheri TaxID=93214 RepID=UPI002FDCD367